MPRMQRRMGWQANWHDVLASEAGAASMSGTTEMSALDLPEAGQLVRVRGEQGWCWENPGAASRPMSWRRAAAGPDPGQLTSVSDDDLGEELTLVWEVEPGREVRAGDAASARSPSWLGRSAAAGCVPGRGRWGTVASADIADVAGAVPSGASGSRTISSSRGAGAGDAAGEPADRRRRGPGQDDRGRPGGAGDAAAPPSPAGAGGMPGVAAR